ncbi:MAG: hypothetical protein WBN88_05415 [Anderseniella sp.]
MSGSDRTGKFTLALAAAAALIFMCGAMGGFLIEQYAKVHQVNAAYQKNSESDRRETSEKIADACQGLSPEAFRVCISDKIETYYTDQSTNEGLKAQKDMALSAFWMFAVSAFMAGLTAAGVWFIYKTLQATKDTLAEAKETSKAAWQTVENSSETDHRTLCAYVVVDSIKGTLTPVGDEYQINVVAVLKNTGITPALLVNTELRIDGSNKKIEQRKMFAPGNMALWEIGRDSTAKLVNESFVKKSDVFPDIVGYQDENPLLYFVANVQFRYLDYLNKLHNEAGPRNVPFSVEMRLTRDLSEPIDLDFRA